MTRYSAQNSQYSSTGVGFQIRNDLYGHISVRYPLFPSQAPASGRTHTCMCARKSAFFRRFSIRIRLQNVINTQAITGQYMPTSFLAHYQRIHNSYFTSPRSLISTSTTPTLHLPGHSSTTSHLRCSSILSTMQTPTACRKIAYTTLADHLKITCESLATSTCYRHTAATYNQGTIEVRWRLDQNNNNTKQYVTHP